MCFGRSKEQFVIKKQITNFFTAYSSKKMHMYLQVKAATGEEVSAEELGGADLHCRYISDILLSFSSSSTRVIQIPVYKGQGEFLCTDLQYFFPFYQQIGYRARTWLLCKFRKNIYSTTKKCSIICLGNDRSWIPVKIVLVFETEIYKL